MFNTNETCGNRLTGSWNLTGFWNFSLPVGILCEIDDTRSIRMGKYGAYLFYKTAKMKKPQFISLSNYILDVEQKETWINLNKERFIDWLENK